VQDDHFVSKFILKSFAVNGRIRVFNKTTKKIESKYPSEICYQRGFTTFAKNDVPSGWDENFLEKELSKWENQIAPIHKKLIEHRTIKAITPEDFWELVRFTVWMHLCNPATRQMLQKTWSKFHLKKVKALRKQDLDSLSLKFFGLLLPHAYLRKLLDSAAGNEQLLQSEFLSFVLRGADSSFHLVMEQYAWRLDDYKDSSLLCTSDRPVLLATTKLDAEVGFGTSEAILHFPLSPNLCLMGRNIGKGRGFVQPCNKVSDPRLAAFNQALMFTKSFNLIIASDVSVLPSLGVELPSYIPEVIDVEDKLGMLMR
jgi:hypothetical protein